MGGVSGPFRVSQYRSPDGREVTVPFSNGALPAAHMGRHVWVSMIDNEPRKRGPNRSWRLRDSRYKEGKAG